MFDSIEVAVEELKKGNIVIVCDDEDRENEGDFLVLAEKATPKAVNFMIKYGRGLVCTPIEKDYAAKFGLAPMVNNNTDSHHTMFTVSVDHTSTTTGISAFDRSATIQAIVNSETTASDFKKPGHIFPLIARDGGVLRRAGHTEAAVDLAKLCDSKPAGVICEIIKEDGSMARGADLAKIAAQFDLKMITIKDLIQFRRQKEKLVSKEIEINLPTKYGTFRALGYSDTVENKDHVALIKGDITSKKAPLVRVHSECLTGDVFGSCRCDCGLQLEAALQQISMSDCGILLYMRQEGRGIGLLNKMKAYKLQEEGYDTVEANEKLGFPPDLRDYGIGAQILRDIGVTRMNLLTNNPKKIKGLNGYGLKVIHRVPLQFPRDKNNEKYLRTKQKKLGHLLSV
ncbi:3,4-dihydroxy 2-butanone 4-phosphate synthase / GTP cyclohydrolase II [Alteribacillus persepolensis]|uniref:Riboflavin biosynthesis protein RibBA n=1 Tax=Alteribacillus persepolensis TaxID=568899 RepID=A0A1G8HSW9_9BACI|nr:bifunctional 3,4-dihydroxy-2-butanone-4-phosphate synthase/GTP cyclohydrolase II [Alteribacillus persepolensis]SDI09757.1 3,4-dihydroxy 2-butanone 4-phosphate synthase / GTP cyclohydrolase II [Alteribacillus persepolensis]